MKLTKEEKAYIDQQCYKYLFLRYIMASPGDTWFWGETEIYIRERMIQLEQQKPTETALIRCGIVYDPKANVSGSYARVMLEHGITGEREHWPIDGEK
ncbi:MAG: hypothetical protein KAR42_13305 [candidate division Zixibacteria bacterium]|nr:hypothetical protein [candidate division Zixibacteria bacterium]